MMNVASLELCRELSKLGGWSVERGFWITTPKRTFDGVEHNEFSYIADYDERRENDVIVPAYELGYLILKLPVGSYIKTLGKTFRATMPEPNTRFVFIADTPEDAAAKLAIELFKQGILKPKEAA